MKILSFSFFITLSFFLNLSFAQITKVPQLAKENFANQYPDAENIEWDNDVVNVNVRFNQNNETMNAEYNNKGIWKST